MELYEYEEEAARDDFIASVLEDLGPEWAHENGYSTFEEAVERFTQERMQSYFEKHPDLAKPCFGALVEAKHLLPSHPSASLVFTTTAIELTVKIAFLTPTVFGLVHSSAFADLIAALTTKHNGMDRFKDLLFKIVGKYSGFDLSCQSWNEKNRQSTYKQIQSVIDLRNKIVHQGILVSEEVARDSYELAEWLLKDLFPRLLSGLGLHLHPSESVHPYPYQPQAPAP